MALLNISFSDLITIIRSCLREILQGLPVLSLTSVDLDDLKRGTNRYTILLDLPILVSIT